MGESYDSIGSRVIRHFRHYINGSCHVWLKGDFVDPEISPKSSQMTSSQDSLTSTSSSSQDRLSEHYMTTPLDHKVPLSSDQSQHSKQPEEKDDETTGSCAEMEESAYDVDPSLQNDSVKSERTNFIEVVQTDIIMSKNSTHKIDFQFKRVNFSKESEPEIDETDKVTCDSDDVIDIRPIINANRKRHATDNTGIEPKCGGSDVTKLRRKKRRAIQDNLNSLRTINNNNGSHLGSHVTELATEAEKFQTILGQRSVYYRSQVKKQSSAET